MKARPYLKKWKACNKCLKEICKNIHKYTNERYFLEHPTDNFRLIADGVNFDIDMLCMFKGANSKKDKALFSVLTLKGEQRLHSHKDLLPIFNYVLNDFKELQLEDAIKITNLKNKQLEFIRSKHDSK